jgi:hypothetical protein
MTNGQKVGVVVGVVLVAIIASVAAFRYTKPGVFMPYKCSDGGDDKRKFYDPNWQARGAVCDGFYIPFGSSIGGKDTTLVLAKMGQSALPKTTAAMKTLAEQSAKLV